MRSHSTSVCMLPWLHRFTNEQGYHLLCCSAIGPARLLRDETGKALHVSQELTDAELLNSADLKSIRLAMLRGEWPSACERCRRTEEAGSVSVRRHMNTRFGHWGDDALGRTGADGTLGRPQVRYADIRLGNTCNLTCRMCGPVASRLWADHHNAVVPPRYRAQPSQLAELRENNWVKRQPVEWLIEQCLPSIESLHFAGGEPLIIPEMLEALEICIRSGRAGQIDVSYNTNLTVIPDKLSKLWPQFRSVSLICSVDGFGKLNEYIRRPSKWSDFDRNLRLLETHFADWRLGFVSCSATVQIYNILQLDELYDYLASGFEKVANVPQLVALYQPSYLSAHILPARVKTVARDRLLALRARTAARVSAGRSAIFESLDAVIAHLEQDSATKELADFLYFSERSDREFGDSWRTACPELAGLLRATD